MTTTTFDVGGGCGGDGSGGGDSGGGDGSGGGDSGGSGGWAVSGAGDDDRMNYRRWRSIRRQQRRLPFSTHNAPQLTRSFSILNISEGTKEAAFATALTAASLVLQISTACEPDKRLGSAACPCKLDGPAHTAQWRHCRSKLAHTAVRFTTSFLSLTYDKSDSLSLMNAHNIRTGLKASVQIGLGIFLGLW